MRLCSSWKRGKLRICKIKLLHGDDGFHVELGRAGIHMGKSSKPNEQELGFGSL